MPTQEEIETAKLLMTLLKDQSLVAEYIRRYGIVIDPKHVKEIKERRAGGSGAAAAPAAAGGAPAAPINPVLAARAARLNAINENNAAAAAAAAEAAANKIKAKAAASGGGAAAPAEDQDPVFEASVNCPICGHTGITCYEMRAKSLQENPDAFLVPNYSGAKGFKTVDYLLLAVTVCPKCLFASPDRKNFTYPSFTGNSEEPSSLAVGVILELKDKTEERKALLPAALDNPDYFKRERTPEVAIESYRLAMARAQTEANMVQPYAHFKMGFYALKIAHIMKGMGQDDTPVLQEALAFFEKSFAKSECTSDEYETQVVYLIVALHIKLGDFNKANSYLGVFGKLMTDRKEQMKKNPALNTKWIEKWNDRARYLWEERENPDAFNKLR